MAVTRVRPGKTGTPPGMEGVRPGSPQAVAAGYKPPKPPKPPGRPGGAPFSPSFNPDGTTTLKPPAPPAAPAPSTTTTTIAFKPDASWWSRQFAADPRYLQSAPMLRSKEEGTAASYGYRIMRSPSGQTMFKSKATGMGGITQVVDEKGNPILDDRGAFQYKDAQGNVYSPADLEMDIQRIQKGEAGYLEGALGAAEAGSEKRQFDIGDVASRTVGARRSGMRRSAADMESQALQSALAGLIGRAAGEFGGIQSEYRDLYNQIYSDLLKSAATTPGTEVTTATPGTPAPETTTIPGGTYGQNVTVGAGGALSGGPGGEFMKVISNATLERNTSDKQIRQNLQSILSNPAFKLTAQQRRYIQSLITGRYKGNKKY